MILTLSLNHLSNSQPLQDDKKDVSYDLELVITNLPVLKTLNFVIEQIYVHKTIKPICSKLIFKRLKLITECKFTFTTSSDRPMNRCKMGGPLSVFLSDMYMFKMENEVTPLNRYYTEGMLMIYLNNVRKILKIFFSKC